VSCPLVRRVDLNREQIVFLRISDANDSYFCAVVRFSSIFLIPLLEFLADPYAGRV